MVPVGKKAIQYMKRRPKFNVASEFGGGRWGEEGGRVGMGWGKGGHQH